MDYRIEKFEKHNDKRGQLVVFLKNSNLKRNYKKFGQIYFITFKKKGIIRGNHYHKKWREWFGVVFGKLQVTLKDQISGKEKKIILDGDSNKYIRLEIGPNIIHTFTSITDQAYLLNYTDTEWSPNDTFLPNSKKKKYG
jgi:dTDP-4-dehydrorhamnose 3,5-epimerase-like enzyme